MAHLSRVRRKANIARRARCVLRQQPVSVQEQAARSEARQAAHAAEYPSPPRYEDGYNRKPRASVRDRDVRDLIAENPILALIGRLMLKAARRRPAA